MKLSVALTVLPLAFAHKHKHNGWPEAEGKSIKFTSVPGYFLQDDNATNPDGFDYTETNFGLIDREYPTDKHVHGNKTQWERFDRWVQHLNARAKDDGTSEYKVLVMGRHGNGWHNAAETYYGTPAWNCYWAEQEGNGTAVWRDAELTPDGVNEAKKANAYFRDRYATQKMPYFESYYVSPLERCLNTANLTFGDLDLPKKHEFVPTVKELFREGMTVHTCNARHNKTHIHEHFPSFKFEKGFTQDDELWSPTESETNDAQDVRAKTVLDDVFRSDDKTWISVTAHSGIISHLLKELNHREFSLGTGQIIPVLVKAEVIELQPEPTYQAHEPYSTCDKPPVTSIDGQGCVCATPTPTPFPA